MTERMVNVSIARCVWLGTVMRKELVANATNGQADGAPQRNTLSGIPSAEYHCAGQAEIQKHADDRAGGYRVDRLRGAQRHKGDQSCVGTAVQHEAAEIDRQETRPLAMRRAAAEAAEGP